MQVWTDLPSVSANKPPSIKRLDGVGLWPYNLHAQRVAEPDEHHVEWGNVMINVEEGARPALRGLEGWCISWPTWRGKVEVAPRLVLGVRTSTAAKEYCDQRFPMPPWWLEVYDDYAVRPPMRVV